MSSKRKPEKQPRGSIRQSSRKLKLRPKKLVLKSTANKHGKRKVAEVSLAMTAPLSKNSNTSGARTVAKQVNELNKSYGSKYNFVIGHLVNEQFGCIPGDKNFVPLTAKANSEHKTQIETPLANFLTKMNGTSEDSFNRAVDNNKLFFAVRYCVKSSSDFWGSEPPDSYVPKSIEWKLTCHVSNEHGVEVIPSGAIKAKFKEFEREVKKRLKLSGTIENRK